MSTQPEKPREPEAETKTPLTEAAIKDASKYYQPLYPHIHSEPVHGAFAKTLEHRIAEERADFRTMTEKAKEWFDGMEEYKAKTISQAATIAEFEQRVDWLEGQREIAIQERDNAHNESRELLTERDGKDAEIARLREHYSIVWHCLNGRTDKPAQTVLSQCQRPESVKIKASCKCGPFRDMECPIHGDTEALAGKPLADGKEDAS